MYLQVPIPYHFPFLSDFNLSSSGSHFNLSSHLNAAANLVLVNHSLWLEFYTVALPSKAGH